MAGRPEFAPTDAQRAQVKAMAGYGVPQDDIAKVAQSLFRKAVEGSGKESVTAAIFWLKCRAGWRDATTEPGKKEQQETIALTAERGTGWDKLLN